jgi:phosphate-selective porin OprO/OprP
VTVALALVFASTGAAQDSASSRGTLCGGDTPRPVTIGFDGHPVLCIGDVARLEAVGKFQMDWRRFDDSLEAATFDLRHARVGTRGVLFRRVEYEVEHELTDRDRPWRDAYVNIRAAPALEIRAGHFKIPFGLEQLIGIMDLDLAYRSAASSYLTPGRDTGVSAHGRLLDKAVRYEAGLFRDGGDNVRGSERADSRRATTLAARIMASPWRHTKAVAALKGLTVGAGLTSGTVAEGTDSLGAETVAGAAVFERVYVDGRRRRMGVDLEWRRGPVALRAEQLWVRDERRGEGTDDNDLPEALYAGGHIGGSWLLTGEKNTGHPAPRRPLLRGGPGAIEVAARVEWLSFGSASNGIASSSPRADHILRRSHTAYTLGVNWHLAAFARVQMNVLRTLRHDGGVRVTGGDTWASVCRLQLGL